MERPEELLANYNIAVVVPAYKVEDQVEEVLRSIPRFVRHIIVVDDASPDTTGSIVERLAREDSRIQLLRHSRNQGVGGAMVTGYRQALELGAQVVVKVDGDGQMPLEYLPNLIIPLVEGSADYTKGNRFRDFTALRRMPAIRRIGNMVLSFLAKAATGYWTVFDPTNGFVGIRGDVLSQLPLDRIHRSYFFETSMLSNLYLLGAVVRDIRMPARYGGEKSSLSVARVSVEFPFRLAACFCRRLVLRNFLYDFTLESLYLLAGIPLLMAGMLWGGYNWVRYAMLGVGAPTGTVVIPTMLILLGFQLLLAAAGLDVQSVPKEPLAGKPLPVAEGKEIGAADKER